MLAKLVRNSVIALVMFIFAGYLLAQPYPDMYGNVGFGDPRAPQPTYAEHYGIDFGFFAYAMQYNFLKVDMSIDNTDDDKAVWRVEAVSDWDGDEREGYDMMRLYGTIEVFRDGQLIETVTVNEAPIRPTPGQNKVWSWGGSAEGAGDYQLHVNFWLKETGCDNNLGLYNEWYETSITVPTPTPSPTATITLITVTPTVTSTPEFVPTPTVTATVVATVTPSPTPPPPSQVAQFQLGGSYLAQEDKAKLAAEETDPGEKAKLSEINKPGEMYEQAITIGYNPQTKVWAEMTGFDSTKESSLCYELTFAPIGYRKYQLGQVILQSDGNVAVINTVPYYWNGDQSEKIIICQEGEHGIMGRVEAILRGKHVELMLAGHGGVPFRGQEWVFNYEWLNRNDSEVAQRLDFAELASRYLFDLGLNNGDAERWQPADSIERWLGATKATGGLGLGAPSVHAVLMADHSNLNVGQVFRSGMIFSAEGQVYDGSYERNASPMINGTSADGKLSINKTPFIQADGTTAYTITVTNHEPGVQDMVVTRDWDQMIMDGSVLSNTVSFTDSWESAPYWIDTAYNYGRAAYWPRYSVLRVDGQPVMRFGSPELVDLYNQVVREYTPGPRFVDWFGRYGESGDYNPFLNINLAWGDRVRALGLNPDSDGLDKIWRAAAIQKAAELGIELPAETPINEITNSTHGQTVIIAIAGKTMPTKYQKD
jgi:hypothetical protein